VLECELSKLRGKVENIERDNLRMHREKLEIIRDKEIIK
jgi:hypothetical protein